jgi:hypothetical protein
VSGDVDTLLVCRQLGRQQPTAALRARRPEGEVPIRYRSSATRPVLREWGSVGWSRPRVLLAIASGAKEASGAPRADDGFAQRAVTPERHELVTQAVRKWPRPRGLGSATTTGAGAASSAAAATALLLAGLRIPASKPRRRGTGLGAFQPLARTSRRRRPNARFWRNSGVPNCGARAPLWAHGDNTRSSWRRASGHV